ncbi:hypothetical protein NA57DRAFT_62880 [Rhizodiscina lignyota]|uniref:Uncharacterized protein n=1 Tax=Rhizodiscina lignyota TaxID=1504668 RepID=A0A9P4ME94_9PEZI|nr:hypothetical protein NA57DRAFT_62880 [Rhizodiscina lignyota]
MPAPVVQVRRKSTANPRENSPEKDGSPKKLNLGSPIGPHGETSTQDKIRKWQTEGGGVAAIIDELAIESESDDKPALSAERQTSPKKKIAGAKGSPARPVVDEDVKRAVAPKKRIVSDAHWVKKVPKPDPPPPPPPEKPEGVWVRKKAKEEVQVQVQEEESGPELEAVWVRKKLKDEIPQDEPQEDSPAGPELGWVRKPVKPKSDEEREIVPLAPLSPVKKTTRPKKQDKTPETPARKPTGIAAWINEVEETPIPHSQSSRKSRTSKSWDEVDGSSAPGSAKNSRYSKSGDEIGDNSTWHSRKKSRPSKSADEEERASDPRTASRRGRRQVSDMSWKAGDESLDIPKPTRKRASSPMDTRDPRERAAELVAKRHDSDHGANRRTRSVSPAAPPLPLIAPIEPLKPKRKSRRERPRSLSPPAVIPSLEKHTPERSSRKERVRSTSPPPEKHTPRRSSRRDRAFSRGKSEPLADSASPADDEGADVELRRLKRSLRERNVPDKSPADEDDEGGVERRRLQRSLKQRNFSYTPTIPSDEVSESPRNAPAAPTETPDRIRSSKKKRSERPKSSHSPSIKQQASETVPAPVPAPAPATAPAPKVFGNRVEAWLTGTQDPFVEDGRSSSAPSKPAARSDVSSSYLASSYFTSSSFTDTVAPSDAISNAQNRAERERRRARLRTYDTRPKSKYIPEASSSPKTPETPKTPSEARDADPEIQTEYSSSASASTLKRSRARRNHSHSPVKEHIASPLRESSPQEPSDYTASTASSAPPPPQHSTSAVDDVASSVTSSSIDPPSFQPAGNEVGPRRGSFPLKRAFPTTGKRLSTIASVETFTTKAQNAAPSIAEGSEAAPTITQDENHNKAAESEAGGSNAESSAPTLKGNQTSLKRRLTKHADLMSVLSLPRTGKSIVSARSIRTNRSRLATATMADLMDELGSDEAKYMRELRTLVDGVIPVLLSCVLSKADSAVAAGLFSRSTNGKDANVTQPIVEMGVALERLKSVHRRIPQGDSDALLTWAQNAQKVYTDYVKAWRLGFQDVVVNLAPADKDAAGKGGDDTAWEDRLPQNEDGDIVNADGERVDVAFLLKRPLVRVKYLSKTLKGINILKPSDQAAKLADAYQNIVILARNRTNEERARLEDEAAANIDPTRARDLKSLAPLAGVSIDPKQFVKARDYFDMHLLHSSGQEIDCRIEILMRDETSGQKAENHAGDLLICEIDGKGRWLFFPPIQRSRVSARRGDAPDQIILMVRGVDSTAQEWRELLSLTMNDEQAVLEWIEMLGVTPVPPHLTRAKSFMTKSERPISSHAPSSTAPSSTISSSYLTVDTASTPLQKSRTPSPREIEIPIGEKAGATSKRWSKMAPESTKRSPSPVSPITPPSEEHYREPRSTKSDNSIDATPTRRRSGDKDIAQKRSDDRDGYESDSPFKSIKEAFLNLTGNGSPTLKRSKAKRLSRHYSSSPADEEPTRPSEGRRNSYQDGAPKHRQASRRGDAASSAPATPGAKSQESKGYSVWYPPSGNEESSESESEDEVKILPKKLQKPRPDLHRRASSVPTLDLPTIPKLRKASQNSVPQTPIKEGPSTESQAAVKAKEPPASAPSKLQKELPARYKRASRSPEREKLSGNPPTSPPSSPPAPPPHRASVTLPLRGSPATQLTPTPPGKKTHRRTSSPLKHEYQPSTASESASETEESASDDDSISSESELDDDDVPLGLLKKPEKPPTPPETLYSPPGGTVAPSQSASQAPYRTVPEQATKASKTIASIFAWSDKGHWESLHPDECSIVITPGLIQAFEMSAAHSLEKKEAGAASQAPSDSSVPTGRPLVGLELTPLVPLRRGTAVDISIRSPPTENSLLAKAGNNIMLRSRSPEECEALYNLINYARINNPTYIALQNARGSQAQMSWAEAMDRQNAARASSATGNSSWWQFGGSNKSKSYRANSTRAASTNAMSESSIRSSASMFSAMKRFSGGGKLFNVARSSVSWKRSSGGSTGNSDSLSGSGASTPPVEAENLPPGTIASVKARLYIRETNNRWRDLGQTKLNIMQPAPPPTPPTPQYRNASGAGAASTAPSSSTNSSAAHSANSAPPVMITQNSNSPRGLQTGPQKRILVQGKTKGEILLDVTLGESCFERVGRTGVAVSVWERIEAPVAARGGVAPGVVKTYMLQTRSERECAYAFSLLGKLRY